MMLEHPNLSEIELLNRLKKHGVITTGPSLKTNRSKLRREGHELPNWRKKGVIFVKLKSIRAAVMRELYANPRATNKEIIESLAQKGRKCGRHNIEDARAKMRNWFRDKDFSIRPEPIILTKAQEALIPGVKQIVAWNLRMRIFPSLEWPKRSKDDFRAFVDGHILRIIKNYDKGKKTLSAYIVMKMDFLLKEYVREKIKQGMGISHTDARLVIRIIREKKNGQEDQAIAKKLKCSKQEVKTLWKSYNTFLKNETRLGKNSEY